MGLVCACVCVCVLCYYFWPFLATHAVRLAYQIWGLHHIPFLCLVARCSICFNGSCLTKLFNNFRAFIIMDMAVNLWLGAVVVVCMCARVNDEKLPEQNWTNWPTTCTIKRRTAIASNWHTVNTNIEINCSNNKKVACGRNKANSHINQPPDIMCMYRLLGWLSSPHQQFGNAEWHVKFHTKAFNLQCSITTVSK